MRVMVTGATGFIGKAVLGRLLLDKCYQPVAVLRASRSHFSNKCRTVKVNDLTSYTDWSVALAGVRVVVHSAGRVHFLHDKARDPLSEFREINVAATCNLARQAALAGVQRFIFLSSIKVNGEVTERGQPFFADDAADPQDPYSISKYEAEQVLRRLADETGMAVVIIRPPLVYGPGVKGNILQMMKWLHYGMPLPFATVSNKRSLVALENLVDLIVTCLDHPAAANQTFLVSDGEDLSTTDLLIRMGEALGTPARLFSLPFGIIEKGAAVLGRRQMLQRLCSSLQVDIKKARELLGWSPSIEVNEGLRLTANAFLNVSAKRTASFLSTSRME